MANVVGTKGQIVIEKEIRDRLGVQPGWKAIQIPEDNHVRIYFIPPEHNRSLYGAARPYVQHWPSPDEDWDEAIEKTVAEQYKRKFRDDPDKEVMGVPEFLDTSLLIRYTTAEPPEVAVRARDLIDSGDPFWVTETALAETAHVLRSVYRLPREQVVHLLIDLVQRANIQVYQIEKEIVIAALLLCRPSGRVSIGDALIWAVARQANGVVYSFDRRFPTEGIDLRQP